VLCLILVRHAESEVPRPGLEDEYLRPLSELGFRQAEDLRSDLSGYQTSAIYSSPYLRAVQTVQPFAETKNLPVKLIEDYREHRMSDSPISNWRDVLRDQWEDHDFVPEGGESLNATKARAISVLTALAADHPNETIILAGHGTIISLTLHMIAPTVGLDFHLAMPNPAVYELNFDGSTWSWAREMESNPNS
jgi:2,3-bisphosphoglycerate-dependent phosphoglycerate mutase